ncbi:MAG TPA: SRPBCC family protein, partial [Dongiaceae bacterium]|nr:SRPBCC family protein [Dongiaceae bacterium]
MKIDIAATLGAVVREVASRKHEGRMARVVAAARSYQTTIEDLWDALTSAERIPRWFLPISGDLRPGGRYQLEGNAGGEITRCEPPRHLAVTWEHGSEVSWLTVTLAEDPNGGTRLQLEHVAHVDDERWKQFGPGAVGVGWDLATMGLGRHLQ